MNMLDTAHPPNNTTGSTPTKRLTLTTESIRHRLVGYPRRLARMLWGAAIVYGLTLFVVSIPFHFQELLTIQPYPSRAFYLITQTEYSALATLNIPPLAYAVWLDVFALLLLGGYVGLGLLIFARRSDNGLAVFTSITLIWIGITYNNSISSLAALVPMFNLPTLIIQMGGLILAVINLYILPDGRFVFRWTRNVVTLWTVWEFTTTLFLELGDPLKLNVVLMRLKMLFMMLIILIGLASQFYRYRRLADEREKQQIRWVLIGLFIGIVGFVVYILPQYLAPNIQQGTGRILFNMVGVPLFIALPGLMIPVTIGMAIQRHRLMGVERIVNRALILTTLTGVLGLIYVAAVLILQAGFQTVTGGQQSPLAITLTTLLIAALFTPLRRRIERIVTNQFIIRERLGKRSTTLINAGGGAAYSPDLGSGRLTGRRLGMYEVEGLIGQGGMAEVYRARHVTLKREAAIKALSPTLAADSDFRRRFEREAQTIAALQHPNIVQVFDYGQEEGAFYMAMAFISGDTLNAYLNANGRMSLPTALIPLRDLASALDYAHGQGVIHRDVKPSNVMLSPTTQGVSPFPYRAILTDFGLARMVAGAAANTHTGVLGTLSYIAPEQISDAKTATYLMDVYALGVVAYQMLTGRVPFSGENVGEVLMAHLGRVAPDPREFAPDLPPEAALALLQALRKDPT
ncbi:MAG TPA: serine/threonine-protein kinase, partial [Aggregatilineales bacterium]|nr:serine/threonine-protein kinase [Aggregatilineales bacterium]